MLLLLSGKKIACFAPADFTDPQAESLDEFCWNRGTWTSRQGSTPTPTFGLYRQPHRYFAFYLPLQAALCLLPLIIWNVRTKSAVMASLRGTEEFCESLIDMCATSHEDRDHGDSTSSGNAIENLKESVKRKLHHFHELTMSSASEIDLSGNLFKRMLLELVVFGVALFLQFQLYDTGGEKSFSCVLPEIHPEEAMCTIPILDLLDFIWSLNVGGLTLALVMCVYSLYKEASLYYGAYQPLFINDFPYGEEDDFNENVIWDNNSTKHSYELLTMIMMENNSIMTKVYVLNALKPTSTAEEAEVSDLCAADDSEKPE